jgi:hypothetical protein
VKCFLAPKIVSISGSGFQAAQRRVLPGQGTDPAAVQGRRDADQQHLLHKTGKARTLTIAFRL